MVAVDDVAMVNGCSVTAAARNTYDHRLRNLVAAASSSAVNDVALPRSTAATWKRVCSQVEVSYSNSMVEALWRQMKHVWLFLNRLDTLAAVDRLVAFYVEQHNSVMPHGARNGRTPDEVFSGEAADLPDRLRQAHHDAIRERIEANRRLSCVSCEVLARAKDARDSTKRRMILSSSKLRTGGEQRSWFYGLLKEKAL